MVAELPVDQDWLERMPLPTGVIVGGRVVAVNRVYLEVVQRSREEVVGSAYDAFVAPEEGDRIRERHAMRRRGEAVPGAYQATVLRPSGERRTVEVFVRAQGEHTLVLLQDVTERRRRQEYLQALARLGAAVQREQSEEAVFRALGAGLRALGAGLVRLLPADEGVRVLSVEVPPGILEQLARVLGMPGVVAVRPWTPSLTRAWADGFFYVDDQPLAAVRYYGEEHGPALRAAMAQVGWTRGAVLRLDVAGQPRELLALLTGWAEPEDEPALALFGAQVGAALDAARSIRELSAHTARLTALDRVATAAGTAASLGELFERAAREVGQVLGCAAVALFLVEEGGRTARLAHSFGGSAETNTALARVPLEGTRLGQVVREGKPRVWYLRDYSPDRQAMLRNMGQDTVVSVPMIVRSRVVGVVNAAYLEERQVDQAEIEILLAMAVHMAAAVESSRLVEDLRTSYADLRAAQQQLVERERLAALGEMAAAVAHEVRNPLGVIFNSVGALRREVGAHEALGILTEEAERINHLVGDLLDFARPLQPVLTSAVPLRSLVEEAVASVVPAGGRIQVEVQGQIEPERVPMDARLMRQVFVNLAENAAQAMPQGGRLEVTVRREERKGTDWAAVEFRDSGPGIAPANLPRIFLPFFTTRAQGTGLGLALVRRIVEGHRGEVEVSSPPEQGASFIVRWPMVRPGLDKGLGRSAEIA